MAKTRNLETAAGIPRALAEERKLSVSGLRYALKLRLPDDAGAPVAGQIELSFDCAATRLPPIDFAPFSDDASSAAAIERLELDGRKLDFALEHGRILIAADRDATGERHVRIAFTAGATGLTRRAGLVYSLFVPARAHKCFPCFDQPDLKASFELELELPAAWSALANAPVADQRSSGDRKILRFAATDPLPSYLFAFVAGELAIEPRPCGDRELWLAATPASAAALGDNVDTILSLHRDALDFLERYTGIAYPFAQLGCVLIPDFEFGGMEHPGVTLYRENLILLPAAADEAARIRRAHLVAHELAHHWFGNLVTMRWFDDVWLKEVFANFMADKIVARAFPHADHALRFALQHIPPAMSVDRTEGRHPIRQPLDNLDDAAALYDAVIYHKAPLAMAWLERRIGKRMLRRALGRYLQDFAHANADWPELAQHLARESEAEIASFTKTWIDAAGPPAAGRPLRFVRGAVYGAVTLYDRDRERGLLTLHEARSARVHAAAWLALYEDMLAGGLAPERLLTAALKVLERQTEPLLVARVLDDLKEIYWRYLAPAQRHLAAGPVERCLRLKLARSQAGAAEAGPTSYWLGALSRFACSNAMLAELESIWRGTEPGIAAPPESLAAFLAMTLALHRVDRAEALIGEQIERTAAADRRARLEFLRPAFSAEAARRDDFFRRLTDARARPRWLTEGAAWLNHPLRADAATHYLEPGLQAAGQLSQRGDIFLPRQWLTALFSGHGSRTAAERIQAELEAERPPKRLRQLILQCADPVLRAARIRDSA